MKALNYRAGSAWVAAIAFSTAAVVIGCGGSHNTASGRTPSPRLSGSPSLAPTASSSRGGGQPHPGGASGGGNPGPGATPQPAGGRLTAHAQSVGTFDLSPSDCGVTSTYAYFHFGHPATGEEARIDITSGYHGAGTYGPGTFGVSASIAHAGRSWIVNFHDSSDATLTIDAGAKSGRISYTSPTTGEAISATFVC